MTRKSLILSGLAVLTAGGALVATIVSPPSSAPALGLTVFDPTNYAQNLLTAARSLEQINNQIRALQNQATMLTGMAKNLSRIDFPQMQRLSDTLTQIDRLMDSAAGIGFRLNEAEDRMIRLFPDEIDAALNGTGALAASQARLEASRAAFRQTMRVQSRIVGTIHDDADALNAIVDRSQGAEGALQAAQATNQILALAAKQQLQTQTLMVAQYRAQAIEAARRQQAEMEGKSLTRRFIGNGIIYTPQ